MGAKIHPVAILCGSRVRALEPKLRARGFEVRLADHLIALLDHIASCISEFGLERGHVVFCDLLEQEAAGEALLRLRRTSPWRVPLVLLAAQPTPLLLWARSLPQVHVLSDPERIEPALRGLAAH